MKIPVEFENVTWNFRTCLPISICYHFRYLSQTYQWASKNWFNNYNTQGGLNSDIKRELDCESGNLPLRHSIGAHATLKSLLLWNSVCPVKWSHNHYLKIVAEIQRHNRNENSWHRVFAHLILFFSSSSKHWVNCGRIRRWNSIPQAIYNPIGKTVCELQVIFYRSLERGLSGTRIIGEEFM